MENQIVEKINHINQEFYRNFAKSFSATRGRIQPGVARLLAQSTQIDGWLDIGCGNGTLAQALIERGFGGRYLGCDFSRGLIEEARQRVDSLQRTSDISLDFQCVDISRSGWADEIEGGQWGTISAFAVLHHIPSFEERADLCRQIRSLLPPNHMFYLSVWQLQNSPRLIARVKPWQTVGIQDDQVEEGDVLMDWRAGKLQGEPSEALRYVHIFTEGELEQLAQQANFKIVKNFYSDGKEGNLALYQTWITV